MICLFRTRTHTHTHTCTHTHTHTHTRTLMHTTLTGPAWVQMLVEAGGQDLLMLTDNDGESCLHAAAVADAIGVAEVRRVRERRMRACVNRQGKKRVAYNNPTS